MLYGFSDPEHIKRERRKGQELRKTQWWRNQLGQGICYHCGQKFAKELLTMDHLIPIARGGKSSKSNCVVCCKDCNSKKGHLTGAEITLNEMRERGEIPDDSDDESGQR
jgi:5-methylcytosine-specific restriction enzyme A